MSEIFPSAAMLILSFVTAVSLLTRPLQAAPAEPLPPFVPWPVSITRAEGRLDLTSAAHVVASDPHLRPLADVVTEEIRRATGVNLAAGQDAAHAGDVALVIDPALADDTYTLQITDRIEIHGHDYNAVAAGTTTLLQSLRVDPTGVTAPRLLIHDHPAYSYRGVMIDCARQFHPLENLKQVVLLARAYKIRYVHLHLSDDQAFTFPSMAFPKLATPGRSYTLAELHELEKYASDRGVIIVPEIDVPGHSGGLNAAAPDVFGGQGSTINCGDEKAVAALDQLIGEILDVFPSSPYFHIGADEVGFDGVMKLPSFQARMQELGTTDAQDVFRWFIGRMDQAIRRRGRTTLAWEGFGRGGKVHVPTDVVVMPFDCVYYDGSQHLLEDRYQVINASWTPLYVVNDHKWPAARIYDWNVYQFGPFSMDYRTTMKFTVPKTSAVLGAQLCAWEQGPDTEIPSIRRRLPAMAERVWNPDSGKDYVDFAARADVTDHLLQRLLTGMEVHVDGLTYLDWDGPGRNVDGFFRSSATVTLQPVIAGTVIRYESNGAPVTASSPAYTKPIEVTASRQTVRAQAFDANGKSVGFASAQTFEHRPIEARFVGQEPGESDTDAPSRDVIAAVTHFKEQISVSLSSAVSGSVVRYSVNGSEPAANSPVSKEAVVLNDSATLRARSFDAANQPVGQVWSRQFLRTGPVPNLTLNKPVTCSSFHPGFPPQNAVDGLVNLNKHWGANGTPQWLKVDLQDVHPLGAIDVFTYWDGRYYQYLVEVSVDDKSWTMVGDMRKNTTPATEHGDHFVFPATPARFIRVTMLKNSANPAVHIVELRAFEAGK